MTHKFKIEIELENKDYCNGCGCHQTFDLGKGFIDNACGVGFYKSVVKSGDIMPRPDICKQNDKEKTK